MAKNKLYPEYKYEPVNRLDILYGTPFNFPQFECDICNKKDCTGTKGKCKGYGAWSYGVILKGS